MSALQWALLLLAIAAVAALYWFSRPRNDGDRRREPEVPDVDQLDLWKSAGGGGAFDEFGVGEPRIRGAARKPPVVDAGPEPVAGDESAPAADRRAEKIVVFYIAEREGTYILGPQLHAALRRQGLRFGERRIYHRLHGEATVFSVASLLKPGVLDPDQAEGFATPGLTVFMVLPCGREAAEAFDDMLATARALASELNAQLYDDRRQVLDAARAAELRDEVSRWAESGKA